jgi:hypothetical protein
MQKPPENESFQSRDGSNSPAWTRWINKLWMVAGALDDSGTTANRPTAGLYVGRPYYDTTLGKPIWLDSVRPTVWHDATGTPV